MVKGCWDWFLGPKMVTTTYFWVRCGVKVGLALVHFSRQDWVSLDWFRQFSASQLLSCLITSIMIGFARLRFESVMYNHHHTPSFELWVVTILAPATLHFTPRWSMFGLIQEFHSISTLPTSHCKYNEWLEKVEVAVWALELSPPHVFQSRVGSKLAWPMSTFFTKIEWVWTDSGNWQHLNPFNVSL